MVEKQRQLYVRGQWHGDDGASSEAGIGKEAVAKLWDVWSDDEVRAACGGRVAVLLDALRLVASEPEQAMTGNRSAVPSGLAADATKANVTAHRRLGRQQLGSARPDCPSQQQLDQRKLTRSRLCRVRTLPCLHPCRRCALASLDRRSAQVGSRTISPRPHAGTTAVEAERAARERRNSNGPPLKNASSLNPSWD